MTPTLTNELKLINSLSFHNKNKQNNGTKTLHWHYFFSRCPNTPKISQHFKLRKLCQIWHKIRRVVREPILQKFGEI